jgi:hypothetical protein
MVFLKHLADTKMRLQEMAMEQMMMQGGPPVGEEGSENGEPVSQRPQPQQGAMQ